MNQSDIVQIVAAGILDMLGIKPDSQLPKSNKFDVKGQTSMTNKKGGLRKFNTAGQRSMNPTVEPIKQGARSPLPVRAQLIPNAQGQLSLQIDLPESGPKPAPRALPAAGQSGGSQPPRGTTVPGTSRGTFQQSRRTRAARANVKPSRATVSTGYGSNPKSNTPVRTGQPLGAADAAEARLNKLKSKLPRIGAKGDLLGQGINVLGAGFNAYENYAGARGEGFSQTDSALQGLAGWTGTLQGARMGAKVPGGPLIKVPAAILGAILGDKILTGAVRGIQGGPPEKAGPQPATPKQQADALVIKQMRDKLAAGKVDEPSSKDYMVKGEFPQSQNQAPAPQPRQNPINKGRLLNMPYNPWYD